MDIIVTFDLSNTSSLYDDFYAEAEKIGLKKFIPAERTSSKTKVSLPNTTLFGDFYGSSKELIVNDIRNKVEQIYKKLKIKGTFIVISADWWGTKKI